MIGTAWYSRSVGRIGRGLILSASVSVVVAGALAGGPALASVASGAAAPGVAPTAGVWCLTFDRRVSPSTGEPVKLTTGVGSTQSTPVGIKFPVRLAVTVTDAEGNPVPGASVTFSAPTVGASGHFAGRSSIGPSHGSPAHTVQVKTDVCGVAVAPVFTANRLPGGYIVKASLKRVRPAAFALVNEAP
jgi:hypothetical protein